MASRAQQRTQVTGKGPIARQFMELLAQLTEILLGGAAHEAAPFVGFQCLPFLSHVPVQMQSPGCLRNRDLRP